MSSERRTRLNWRSQKKHDLQTLETCLSRLRSSANKYYTDSAFCRFWSLITKLRVIESDRDITDIKVATVLADLESGNDMSIGRVELSRALFNGHQSGLVLLQKPDVSHCFSEDVAFVLL